MKVTIRGLTFNLDVDAQHIDSITEKFKNTDKDLKLIDVWHELHRWGLRFEDDEGYGYVNWIEKPKDNVRAVEFLKRNKFPTVLANLVCSKDFTRDYNAVNWLLPKIDSDKHFLLIGEQRSGKTTACIKAIAELFKEASIQSCAFLRTNDINRKKSNWEDFEWWFDISTDALLIDDLGAEYLDEERKSLIFELLDIRLHENKHTFVTSNLSSAKEIETRYNIRIKDRLSRYKAGAFSRQIDLI